MRTPSDIIADLAALGASAASHAGPSGDRLQDMTAFGSNPGNLRARIYVPDQVAAAPALVVVLHGCTQTAAGYDSGAGWSRLADDHGFVLLFPEQSRANNPNLCFNWFVPQDIRRDGGEALSIRQMIDALVGDRGIDPARIFVTGLSAGGAMTSVMLATYPEMFAGGAIIAGLPYGCATNAGQAFERMHGHGNPDAAELSMMVRRASPHQGPWPTLSIWHGTADTTVSPSNAEAILAQWRPIHGVDQAPSMTDLVDGHPRRTWHDADRRAVIEDYRIAGMGHGTPLDTRGDDPYGAIGPFMLEAGISSTRHIAAFWGLTDDAARPAFVPDAPAANAEDALPVPHTARPERIAPAPDHGAAIGRVGKIIEDALRAAGLMR